LSTEGTEEHGERRRAVVVESGFVVCEGRLEGGLAGAGLAWGQEDRWWRRASSACRARLSSSACLRAAVAAAILLTEAR